MGLEDTLQKETSFLQRVRGFFTRKAPAYTLISSLTAFIPGCVPDDSVPAGCQVDTDCKSERICEDGECVEVENYRDAGTGYDSNQSCSDQCSPYNSTRCSGNAVQTCGNYDSDDCLEWSSGTNCQSDYSCNNGECVADTPACTDQCSLINSTRCSGNAVQTCGDYDSDSCLEWSAGDNCQSGYSCDDGECVADTPACTDQCSPINSTRCSGNAVQTCGNYDSDVCLEWSSGINCQSGYSCDDGECTLEQKIVFLSKRDGNSEIYIMNADGTNQTNLTNNPAADYNPNWSPDGTKIAFESKRDGYFEIYIMDFDGSNQTNITNNPTFDADPSWSPNGNKIAFYSNRDGNGEIYVMNSDGSNQTNLTNFLEGDFLPNWSPNGTKISFTSFRDDIGKISVMDVDGSNQIRLIESNSLVNIVNWSQNGDKLSFHSFRDGNDEIYVINSDGSNQARLTNDSAVDWYPAWSPDGNKIAFASNRDGNFEIYVMNSDGTNQTRLTNNSAWDEHPTWSSDGTKIAFVKEIDGNFEIYVMNSDGTNQTRLTNNPAQDTDPSWSPF